MSEEEKKNYLCEDDDDEDDDDDDYEPTEDDAKGLSFIETISKNLNSFKNYSIFLDSNKSDDSNNEDEENLNSYVEEKTEVSKSSKLSEEEKKKRADELWQDLCSSTSSKNLTTENKKLDNVNQINKKQDIIKVTKQYDFAGEKVEVIEEVKKDELESNKLNNSSSNKRSLGIKGLVANLGKKQKLSTLNKTKLDWDLFKKEEGLEDDLKNHVKNKSSFIERQAFLQRTDLKQFELEKQVREKNRSKN